MSWLLETVYEYTLLEEIINNLCLILLVPFFCAHLFKWLYWKTKKEFFKKINWLCSPQEIDAYCAFQDEEKQKLVEKKEHKRGRD